MYTVQEGRFMLQMSHIGFRPLPVIAAFSYNTVTTLCVLFLILTTTGRFWEPTLKFSGKSFLGEKNELLSQGYGMNEYNKTIE